MTQKYDIHDLADMFPAMTGEEYETFLADVHENGVRVPVVLYEGKILDGRHRYQAVQELEEKRGVSIAFDTWEFCGDQAAAIRYVMSVNAHRRHLTIGQRACIANEIKGKLQETIRQGQRTDLTSSINGRSSEGKDAAEIAADIMHVSRASVYNAAKLSEEAPDLYERVRAGEMPITSAATALAIRNGEQTQAQAVKAVASEIVSQIGVENITDEKLEKIGRVITGETTNVHVSDDNYEWYTPSEYIEAARQVLGEIDLDAASSDLAQKTVKAHCYFTKEDDALQHKWIGRLWLNPPYCVPQVVDFVTKAIAAFDAGDIPEAIILLNNATDTTYFQELLSRFPACFTRGRIHFYNPLREAFQPRQGQAFLYLGDNPQRFKDVFSQFGTVVSAL